jgi:hypothetical protein
VVIDGCEAVLCGRGGSFRARFVERPERAAGGCRRILGRAA